MCGIAGILSQRSNEQLNQYAQHMAQALTHRGPDAHDTWINNNTLAMVHTRLSIQDLSPNGSQPMASYSGRYTIVFNGEIYNFHTIRKELETLGHKFKGGSDTEVLLAAIEEYGLTKAIVQFEGMFAFALWDTKDQSLTLCRDRLGEKPLYYGWFNNQFIWASELKALHALPFWSPKIREDSIPAYLQYGYIPTPFSMYQDCYKLIPGSTLKLTAEQIFNNNISFSPYCSDNKNEIHPEYYWKFSDVVATHKNRPTIDYNDAVNNLDQLLQHVVSEQMISDVPYGAFLSGGIDSSLVTSIMQSLSPTPINTFTIGFNEKDFNEALFAKDISKHLGTNHHELYISSNDCLNLVPKIPEIMDEPFADSSVLPAYFVSALAREHVTVCLSGDGGDELFCGYNRYTKTNQIWNKVKSYPLALRKVIAALLNLFPATMVDQIYSLISSFLNSSSKNTRVGLKLQKLAKLLKLNDIDEIYEMLISYCTDSNITVGLSNSSPLLSNDIANQFNKDTHFIERAMAIDTTTYLLDDNLVKVDRTSMASSLETRLPLLNHKVLEYAWSLPLEAKLSSSSTKRILRDVLYKRVPRELIERPKMGFSVPIAEWLRGSLKDWAENLLLEKQNLEHGYLDSALISKLWQSHLSGKEDNTASLWSILMFQQLYLR